MDRGDSKGRGKGAGELTGTLLDIKEMRHELLFTYLNVSIALQIREMRKARGLTQEALAEKSGVTYQTISRAEALRWDSPADDHYTDRYCKRAGRRAGRALQIVGRTDSRIPQRTGSFDVPSFDEIERCWNPCPLFARFQSFIQLETRELCRKRTRTAIKRYAMKARGFTLEQLQARGWHRTHQ